MNRFYGNWKEYFQYRVKWWGGENGFYRGLKTRKMDFLAVSVGALYTLVFTISIPSLIFTIFDIAVFKKINIGMLYFTVYSIFLLFYGIFFMNKNIVNNSKLIGTEIFFITIILAEMLFTKLCPLLVEEGLSIFISIILGIIFAWISYKICIYYWRRK